MQDKCFFIFYGLLYIFNIFISYFITCIPNLIITHPSWTVPSFLPNAKAHGKASKAAGKPYRMHRAICLYT